MLLHSMEWGNQVEYILACSSCLHMFMMFTVELREKASKPV